MDQQELATHILSVRDKVFRFAKSMLRDSVQAQDLTQDVCEKLWQRSEKLGVYDNFEAFVITVAKNMCLDRLRLQKLRDSKYDAIMVQHNQCEPSPVAAIEQRDMRQVVNGVIGELPEKLRMVIHLRDIEEMDIEEIAQIMEIDPPTIRVYLSRARKIVREKLIKIINHGVE